MLLVSHCDFSGASAYHVYAIACDLHRRGWFPAIAVPGRTRGVRDLGRPPFHVLSYAELRRGGLRFPDGQGPDLAHAFTPREPVRRVTLDAVRRFGTRHVVHLEDNELVVSEAIVSRYDIHATSAFLEGAVGMTAIVDRLLEFKPARTPGVVFWPGYDPAIDDVSRPRAAIRHDIGLEDADKAVVYPGNVHEANVEEVRALYEAVVRLREAGHRLVLVKSGFNSVSSARLPRLGGGIRDLGWIRRERVFELLHAADICVQPGAPGPFNDYRFPSKLPEFLASGRPVLLPRANLGLHLRDRVEALLLELGDADEVCRKLELLISAPSLGAELGANGRRFALRELQWSKSVDRLVGFYDRVLESVRARGLESDDGR